MKGMDNLEGTTPLKRVVISELKIGPQKQIMITTQGQHIYDLNIGHCDDIAAIICHCTH